LWRAGKKQRAPFSPEGMFSTQAAHPSTGVPNNGKRKNDERGRARGDD